MHLQLDCAFDGCNIVFDKYCLDVCKCLSSYFTLLVSLLTAGSSSWSEGKYVGEGFWWTLSKENHGGICTLWYFIVHLIGIISIDTYWLIDDSLPEQISIDKCSETVSLSLQTDSGSLIVWYLIRAAFLNINNISFIFQIDSQMSLRNEYIDGTL